MTSSEFKIAIKNHRRYTIVAIVVLICVFVLSAYIIKYFTNMEGWGLWLFVGITIIGGIGVPVCTKRIAKNIGMFCPYCNTVFDYHPTYQIVVATNKCGNCGEVIINDNGE